MATRGYTLFNTPIGPCSVAWGDGGITGVQLPEVNAEATRARILVRFPDVSESQPPTTVARAVNDVVAVLEGRGADLSGVALDLTDVPPFHKKVYALARTIPPGKTLTYGALAARAGSPSSARAVGQAMGKNPFPVVVPCHRVLAANGKPGGFSATGGVTTKLRMLAIEREAERRPVRPLASSLLAFNPDEAVSTFAQKTLSSGDPTSFPATTLGPARGTPSPFESAGCRTKRPSRNTAHSGGPSEPSRVGTSGARPS
jgi:methylated-DNA-[protein]-cysteine S-methyltransferase